MSAENEIALRLSHDIPDFYSIRNEGTPDNMNENISSSPSPANRKHSEGPAMSAKKSVQIIAINDECDVSHKSNS